MSSALLALSCVFAALGLAAHADYRASGNPGGVLSPGAAEWTRNVLVIVAVIAACVGASLRVGGF